MRNFFEPASAPSWVKQILNSIRAALGDIWPTPLRLFAVATADRPDAAQFGGGLIFDSTDLRPAFSNGGAWFELMPYNGGAALTKTDDANVTLTLGGAPATALLAAASLTLGWSGTLSAARGGTGTGSYSVGDLLYASGGAALTRLAGVATGNALISGGVTTAPSWGKIGLTTHVSGTLAVGNGGTGVTSSTGTGSNVLSANPTFTGNVGINNASPNAQLHIGAGNTSAAFKDGAGSNFSPQVQVSLTSGLSAVGVYVNDGTNNRRAALFVDQANGLWGLSSNYSSGAPPFVIRDASAERLRIDASGNLSAGGAATFNGQITHGDTSADSAFKVLIKGTVAGLRLGTDATNARVEGVDNTGSASYKPLFVNGSALTFAIGNFSIFTVDSTGPNLGSGKTLRVNGTQVLAARRTGWSAPTGTATRTSFATSTATTQQVAEALKALIDDLTTHGVIGA